jgi:hypothetical protein
MKMIESLCETHSQKQQIYNIIIINDECGHHPKPQGGNPPLPPPNGPSLLVMEEVCFKSDYQKHYAIFLMLLLFFSIT